MAQKKSMHILNPLVFRSIVSIRAARYSKINLDIVLSCLNIQDNNQYNICTQFSI